MRRALFIAIPLLVLIVGLVGVVSLGTTLNEEFEPQDEFLLDDWIPIKLGPIDLSINRAVVMLLLSGAASVLIMTLMARRLHAKPNRTQTAIELIYQMLSRTITQENIEREKYARRWFPFLVTVFFFIWLNNLLGFLPLPLDSHNSLDIFGLQVPQLAIYAATANLSVPLILAVIVWVSYNVEGIREKGLAEYLRSWVPSGVPNVAKPFLFAIEFISHFVRLISLSVRLFANMLAGHMLILIMGAGMVILLGNVFIAFLTLPIAIGFYVFEVVLVANLQAFIFTILSAIYIGEATAEAH